MSNTALVSLFGFKAWADAELCTLLKTLPQEQSGPLRVCIRTLNHIHVVDELFRSRLAGEPEPFDATNTVDTPALDTLRTSVEATDAWYRSYVSAITDEELSGSLEFTFTDGDRGRMTREEILLHVATHGGYHRGSVGQVLKSISIAPPRDLYTRFLHLEEPTRREAP